VSSDVATVSALTHRYKKVAALDGVSLSIPGGCMVGLIGPDGVGKSTLLALLSGARRIQSGRIQVLGGDMAQARHRREVCPRIAYMPQGLGKNLYATLSVFENVDFFARLFGQAPPERHARIQELLDSTGLAPFAERPAGKLSGGMKQKLGLCCALIHDPDLLILDEPTTGVDPLSRRQFWELIDRIRGRRPGMSVLVATAYMEEAERFDHLVAMDAGKVLATGSPQDLKQRTSCDSLEEAFISLLPAERRQGHHTLVVPPRTGADGDIAIEAHDLTCRFGDFTAVDHVNLAIHRGEIFGFLGSNGCGKTTTMKMLTGLLPATEGTASLFGQAVDANDMAVRRRVGYMSQGFSLYSELTVRQNLVLHAKLFHVPPDTLDARVNTMLARFELNNVADDLPDQLPLGVRQRLSLAVAVVHQPDMLILDGRGPGRARQLLGIADQALARRRRHAVHLDALHERGRALRPHLADARGARAGQRHARSAGQATRLRHAGGHLHQAAGTGAGGRCTQCGSRRCREGHSLTCFAVDAHPAPRAAQAGDPS